MPSHPCNDNFSRVGTWKIDVPTTCSIVMSIESCFFSKSSGAIDTHKSDKESVLFTHQIIIFQFSLPELWLEEGTLEDYHVICIYIYICVKFNPSPT